MVTHNRTGRQSYGVAAASVRSERSRKPLRGLSHADLQR